jgi:hypothetical protein
MLRGEVISDASFESITPGGGGKFPPEGNISQYLEPVSGAFHALVAFGSL